MPAFSPRPGKSTVMSGWLLLKAFLCSEDVLAVASIYPNATAFVSATAAHFLKARSVYTCARVCVGGDVIRDTYERAAKVLMVCLGK